MAETKKRRASPSQFRKGDPRAREAGKKGGAALAAARRRADGPYGGTILDVMDAAGMVGKPWAAWRVFWKAVFGLPMEPAEVEVYRRHTEREAPPAKAADEAWMPIGRRGGKSRNAALCAAFLGMRFNAELLAPGETAVIPIIAADRKQARQVIGYVNGIFELLEFKPYLHRSLKEGVELNTRVNIEVHTGSFRAVRGYTVVGAVCDEIAFWRTDDGSANPDTEILTALRPGMATIPDALLLALSNPYAARGELFAACERYFGQDDPDVLVWNSDSLSMNPSLPLRIVERARELDPVAAASEYGENGRVQFRRDVEAYLSPEVIRSATITGRRELPPQPGVVYRAFVDPSGGSQDSFVLAVGHQEGDVAVLDAIREVRPPFSPDSVVKDFADFLRTYRVTRVKGDRYAGEWPRERFKVHGIQYDPSELTKSDIYREFVAPMNAGRVQLLDLPVLRSQLQGLERRVSRGGRDSIDHGPGAHDDVANAAAGVLVTLPRRTPAPPNLYTGMSY